MQGEGANCLCVTAHVRLAAGNCIFGLYNVVICRHVCDACAAGRQSWHGRNRHQSLSSFSSYALHNHSKANLTIAHQLVFACHTQTLRTALHSNNPKPAHQSSNNQNHQHCVNQVAQNHSFNPNACPGSSSLEQSQLTSTAPPYNMSSCSQRTCRKGTDRGGLWWPGQTQQSLVQRPWSASAAPAALLLSCSPS